MSLLYQGVCTRFKSARSFGDYISFWAKWAAHGWQENKSAATQEEKGH